MAPVLRQAARLLVIAPDGRVLLFQYEDGPRTWWALPGGGLEGEETFEEAAAREAAEELSLPGTPSSHPAILDICSRFGLLFPSMIEGRVS